MSSTITISQADGAITIGHVENNPALLAADPRGDARGIALQKLDYDAILTWAGRLHTLAELGDGTATTLKNVSGAVDWKGSGANAFTHAMATTTPELSKLSQSYLDASHAMFTYAINASEEQSRFNGYARQIAQLTYELTGFEDQRGTYVPGTPKVLPSSANFASVCSELTTAKQNGFNTLDSFDTTRQTMIRALQSARDTAPKAPPWWLKQMDGVLGALAGVKGVSATDLNRARGLARAEQNELKDPSAANKRTLDEDLAALGLIATAAAAAGRKGLAGELLDDETGSLQQLSDHEAGGLAGGRNVAATQAEQDRVVADVKAGNVKGAERELQEMAQSTEGQGTNPATVKATDAAQRQASQEAKAAAAAAANGLSATAQQKIDEMTRQADAIMGKPYVWGGGHSGWGATGGYDCSGFVSKVLHAAGYLSVPCTTQSLPGQPGIENGPGQHVTIYDRTDAGSDDHVIIDINGQFYECGGEHGSWGGGGGVEKIGVPSRSYLDSFNLKLHPAGL